MDVEVGDRVEYARSKNWVVVTVSATGGTALIEDPWDIKMVPISSLKKVKNP